MTITAIKRNFNRTDGRQKDAGFAPGMDERMARQARQAEREKRAAMRRAQANPVKSHHDLIVVRNGEIDPLLPADFLAESLAMLEIHLARGHFAQAKETIDAIEQRWSLKRKLGASLASPNDAEKLAWHVTAVFDQRTANELEKHCNGTLGSVLEIFPEALLRLPGVGMRTIEKIATTLVRNGLLSPEEGQARVERWSIGMED